MISRKECIEKARKVTSQMTLEEKASQLLNKSPAIERLGIPEYNWWNEALHGMARAGTATVFPQAIALAAMFDDDMMEKIGDVVSTEGRAKYNESILQGDRDIYKGLTVWSPNVNIFRDPRWGRGHETYGEDPYLTSKIGTAYVKGLQGNGKYMKLAACAKHFAVHSGPEGLRHGFDARVSRKELYETYLPAFKALVDADVEAVMGAYNRVNGEACCASKSLLTDILRNKWHFEGHVVSDFMALCDVHGSHAITKTPEETCGLAIKAGCNINAGCTYNKLIEAYNDGLVSEEDIDNAVVRALATRIRLGLFAENGTEYDNLNMTDIDTAENAKLAEKAAEKSCVLLKNDGILPLDIARISTIGIIGPNADSIEALIGNYHGTASHYETVLSGIKNYCLGKCRVLYSVGCNIKEDRTEPLAKENDRISEAMAVARHSDVIIVCTGLDEHIEGEEGDAGNSYASGDKLDLQLPKPQRKLLNALSNCGKPVIVINMTGSAIALDFAEKSFNAILQGWYAGELGGEAIAKILFGDVSPSGKLPVTFYSENNTLPDFCDYSMKGRTYRYMTEKPLYSFGYGLSYANIRIVTANVGKNSSCIDIELENKSSFTADEVVQLYIKDNKSNLAVPNLSLCGFKRINVAANEKAHVEIPVPESAFMVVGDDGESFVDSDSFTFVVSLRGPDDESAVKLHYKLK